MNENVVHYNSSLEKPQLLFKDCIDNSIDINEEGFYDNPYTYEISSRFFSLSLLE